MKRFFDQYIGWYGAAAILLGFTLISFSFVSPASILYRLLNLTGGLAIAYDAYIKRAYPSVALNLVYATVAAIALVFGLFQ